MRFSRILIGLQVSIYSYNGGSTDCPRYKDDFRVDIVLARALSKKNCGFIRVETAGESPGSLGAEEV